MREWLLALDLRDITLVCQDWGGLIGLRLAAEHPERFARIVAGEGFLRWQKFSQETPNFAVGAIVNGGCTSTLSAEVMAAYDAPFPDDSYKAGARQFPLLVPTSPDDPAAPANRKSWEVLRRWQKPFLTAFSDRDPVTRGGEAVLKNLIPGAAGQPHTMSLEGNSKVRKGSRVSGDSLQEVATPAALANERALLSSRSQDALVFGINQATLYEGVNSCRVEAADKAAADQANPEAGHVRENRTSLPSNHGRFARGPHLRTN